ncbi:MULTISPECIES: hypothetical protein [Okeania]|uniref:hypothetical protein n=1 Tax=Okeania TaxID=1458928 RepID=UPI0019620D95|nr:MULTISPECIES: hypothetical protein [Okeania]
MCGGKGLPDGGWEEIQSEVQENIRAGRDINTAGRDINMGDKIDFSGTIGEINIGDIGSKRS